MSGSGSEWQDLDILEVFESVRGLIEVVRFEASIEVSDKWTNGVRLNSVDVDCQIVRLGVSMEVVQ